MPDTSEYKLKDAQGTILNISPSELKSRLLDCAKNGNLTQIKEIYKLNSNIPNSWNIEALRAANNADKYDILEFLTDSFPGIAVTEDPRLFEDVASKVQSYKSRQPQDSKNENENPLS